MPLVIYIQPDGNEMAVDVPTGWTAMEGAVRSDVPGIVAACGGSCTCATCHVYVNPAWFDRLPPVSAWEVGMLANTAEPATPTSRLSCQILISSEIDGIRLLIAAKQL